MHGIRLGISNLFCPSDENLMTFLNFSCLSLYFLFKFVGVYPPLCENSLSTTLASFINIPLIMPFFPILKLVYVFQNSIQPDFTKLISF